MGNIRHEISKEEPWWINMDEKYHKLCDIATRYKLGKTKKMNLDKKLIDEILKVCFSDRAIIYVTNIIEGKLISRLMSEKEQFQCIPVDNRSIPGNVALLHRTINIKNVYNKNELVSIDRYLEFDYNLDNSFPSRTKMLFARPIKAGDVLLGVLQLSNKKDGTDYSKSDVKNIKIVSYVIFDVIHRQNMRLKVQYQKCEELLRKNVINQEEFEKVIIESERRKISILEVLPEIRKDLIYQADKILY